MGSARNCGTSSGHQHTSSRSGATRSTCTAQELANQQPTSAKEKGEAPAPTNLEQGIGAFASKYQPQPFDGEDDRWREWFKVFRSWSGRCFGGHLRSNCCLWSAAPAVRSNSPNLSHQETRRKFLKNQIFGGNSNRPARASWTTDVLVSVGCGRGHAGHVRLEPSLESPLVESLWMSPSRGKLS